MWAGFFAIVLVMLAIDLFVVGGGKQHRVSLKEAATWSGIWVGVSFLFAGALWWYLDGTAGRELANEKTLEYITGYLIEKSLAVDNVFVWLMLFSFFAIPLELQKRVLVLGVLGAIVMRTVMIFAGVWLITQFHWLLYVFGAFLLITGIKMWWFADETPDLANNPAIKWIRRHMKVTDELQGEHFFVMKEGAGKLARYATPLFLVLILVEITDLIFAVDSIPAIFADLEHFRHPWSARHVLPARRRRRPLLAAQVRPGHRAHVHRRQDAADRPLQDPGGRLSRSGRSDHRHFDYPVPE
jgi:tellurite resistance protein TerC